MIDRELFLGFVKIHILHHASKEPIFGVGIMTELNRHGYCIGPGTLNPRFIVWQSSAISGSVRNWWGEG